MLVIFFFSSRRRHTRYWRDWSSDVCSSDLDRLVEVVAAEVVVAGGRLDLEDAVADLEHGHVERAAAEVEDEDRLVGLLVEPVGERRRRRLVEIGRASCRERV